METSISSKILVNSPDFNNPDPKLEQYATPVDTTLEIIKKANYRGHLSGKVADLGCGTGRLAIGAAIIGADNKQISEICDQDYIVVTANDNAPGQIVISGEIKGVKIAIEKAKRIGRDVTKSIKSTFELASLLLF